MTVSPQTAEVMSVNRQAILSFFQGRSAHAYECLTGSVGEGGVRPAGRRNRKRALPDQVIQPSQRAIDAHEARQRKRAAGELPSSGSVAVKSQASRRRRG